MWLVLAVVYAVAGSIFGRPHYLVATFSSIHAEVRKLLG
jgi:hypothetical protein